MEYRNINKQDLIDALSINLDIQDLANKIVKDIQKKKEQLLIDDIIAIYNGAYKNYCIYLSEKCRVINEIDIIENRKTIYSGDIDYLMPICVKPEILKKETFEYIKKQGARNE